MNRCVRRMLAVAVVGALFSIVGASTAQAQRLHVGFYYGGPGAYHVYSPYVAPVPPPVVIHAPPPPVVVYRPPAVVYRPPVVVARPHGIYLRYGPVRGPRAFW